MAKKPKIKYLGQVRRLALKPGDRVVLTASCLLSMEARERIAQQVKPFFPDHQVIILDDNLKLGVMG